MATASLDEELEKRSSSEEQKKENFESTQQQQRNKQQIQGVKQAAAQTLKGGGSITDAAKAGISWWVLDLIFGSLFTVVGFIPALLYLDFHYLMSRRKGSKLFGPMSRWQKILLAGANLLALLIPIILTLFIYTVVYAVTCGNIAVKGGVKVIHYATFGISPDFCAAPDASLPATTTTNPNPTPTPSPQNEQANRDLLARYGILVNKNCIDPTKQLSQTCVGGMLPATLQEIINFSQACDKSVAPNGPADNRCGVMLTGGSEPGHETGPCSHSSGNKFDMNRNPAIDAYVYDHSTLIGRRSDGTPLFRFNPTGVTYAGEFNPGHWDVGGVGC